MRQKRILSQKRPAAGGEARERASFLILCEIAFYERKEYNEENGNGIMEGELGPLVFVPEKNPDFLYGEFLLLHQVYLNVDAECQKPCLPDRIPGHEEETGAEGRCYGKCCRNGD